MGISSLSATPDELAKLVFPGIKAHIDRVIDEMIEAEVQRFASQVRGLFKQRMQAAMGPIEASMHSALFSGNGERRLILELRIDEDRVAKE